MAERTLRGARLGGQSFEDERGIEFAARQQAVIDRFHVYGHDFRLRSFPANMNHIFSGHGDGIAL